MEKKKKKRRINYTQMFIAILTMVIAAYAIMQGINIGKQLNERKRIEEETKMLLSEKEALQEELRNINSKEYIEDQARKRLKLARPGETIFIIESEEDEN